MPSTSERYRFPNKVLALARSLGFGQQEFSLIGPSRWQGVLDAILTTFTRSGLANRERAWFWEDLVEPSSCISVEANLELRSLAALGAATDPINLLLEDWDRTQRSGGVWLFEGTLEAALAVLDELDLQEFYLVARDLSWLMCENHHSVRIAVGQTAISILESRISA